LDVGNAYLYATAEAEAQACTIGSEFLIDERSTMIKARGKALDAFGPELIKHLDALKGITPSPKP